jgi:hypothetical protein
MPPQRRETTKLVVRSLSNTLKRGGGNIFGFIFNLSLFLGSGWQATVRAAVVHSMALGFHNGLI